MKVPLARNTERIQQTLLEDTGSTDPLIYIDDLERMINKSGFKAPFLCYKAYNTANGTKYMPTCKIFFNLETGSGRVARPWVPAQTSVCEDPFGPGDARVSGDWIRRLFYTASAPDNLGNLFISETLSGLKAQLPDFDVRGSQGPLISLPPPDHPLARLLPGPEFGSFVSL